MMKRTNMRNGIPLLLLLMMFCMLVPVSSHALILGEPVTSGTPVNFTAMDGHIRTGDGDSIYMWGYALPGKPMQYPGPTLIVNQGDTVVINLTNRLPVPVSLVFPGQSVTTATVSGTGVAGLLTTEVPPDNGVTTVSYTFTPTQPGTYTYYSGTNPDLQVEMGLVGALIVRPTGFALMNPKQAYLDTPVLPVPNSPITVTAPISAYEREYLFLLTEIDPELHLKVEQGQAYLVDNTTRRSVSWFINGRNFPDTMAMDNANYLPSQPYSAMPQMHPGERVLMRMIGAGRNLHPFHTHGQNHLVIARDGRLMNSSLNNGDPPNLAVSDFTTTVVPGETADAIWGPWTGAKLGWDVYGNPADPATVHTCNNPTGFDTVTFEYCPDHGKPFPVELPAQSDLTFGPMYGGTPFLGLPGSLPPANVSQNPNAGLSYMWHSHAERELTTNNIFLGGMATMAIVLPYSVLIP
jgi:FtsP/CotA-like multicopper oxidase with cupredoxin domain